MRLVVLSSLVGCSFTPGALPGARDAGPAMDGGTPDGGGSLDAQDAPAVRLCDADTSLLVCLSFDTPTFAATLANEGTANVSAQLTAVTRSAHDNGGAAEVTTASKIYIPPDPSLTGVRTIEMWVRIDVAPASNGSRVGLLDADATASAMSFFYYKQSSGFQIRSEIGVQMFTDQTLATGAWIYFAEVCDAGTLTAYVDGSPIDSTAGCNPGIATSFGLIIGANNLQNGNKDSELTGAIDGLRIWTSARTPTQICEAAGKTTCP